MTLLEPPDPRSGPLRRVALALGVSCVVGLIISPSFVIPTLKLIAREMFLGLVVLTVFDIFETWPRRLPGWIARWAV